MQHPNPVLVTGSHRSGTTWVGRMLAASPDVGYVHEPFNLSLRFGHGPDVEHWYQYVDATNAAAYEPGIRALLDYGYPLGARLRRARSVKDLGRILKNRRQLDDYRRRGVRLVVKDPLAFFAAEWLAATFDFDVVVLIRHPAAFCSSLKLKDWRFDFAHFTHQPRLLDTLLQDYAQPIRARAASPGDLLDEATLLWCCVHQVAVGYQERHPEWIFVRHEDLSRDPLTGFRSICDRLGVGFSADIAEAVEAASGTHNPVEQVAGAEFSRNSRANIFNWKSRLAENEIVRIREATEPVAHHFYGDEDW